MLRASALALCLLAVVGCATQRVWKPSRPDAPLYEEARGLCNALAGAPPIGNTAAMTDYVYRFHGCMNAQGWQLVEKEAVAETTQSDSRSVAYYAIEIKESYLPESDEIGLLGPDLDAPEPIQLAAIKSRDGTIFYALMDWNDGEVFGEVSATSLEHDPSILIAVSFSESGTRAVAIPVGYARAMVSRALSARFPGED